MTTPTPSPELELIATRIVAALIGWRWTWPLRRVVETYRVPYRTRTVSLYGRPVSAVNSVTGPSSINGQPGETIDPNTYQLNNGCQLWLLQPSADWWWPGGLFDIAYPAPWMSTQMAWRNPPAARDITVDYTYGSPPPPDIQRAINILAEQFAIADTGAACSLPERVTSVNREGVSWTLIDPQDFLDNGRTGIYYVDLVIKAYAGTRARSSVMSPEIPVPRRISSVLVDLDGSIFDGGAGSSIFDGGDADSLNPNILDGGS